MIAVTELTAAAAHKAGLRAGIRMHECGKAFIGKHNQRCSIVATLMLHSPPSSSVSFALEPQVERHPGVLKFNSPQLASALLQRELAVELKV